MTSLLNLFLNCKITPEKNFKVDGIENYLFTGGNLTRINVPDFQYIKHSLTLEIKVNLSQTYLNAISSNNYNYARIRNGTEKPYYYFVVNKKWKGESTIQLTLLMDTINTFIEGTDFNFNDKTKINRQHKDRFLDVSREGVTKRITIPNTSIILDSNGEYTKTLQSSDFIGYDEIGDETINILSGSASYNISYNSTTGTIVLTLSGSPYGGVTYRATIDLYKEPTSGYAKIIDLPSEGLTPILYGSDLGLIEDETAQSWYLVYKSSGTSVRCLLYAENTLTTEIQGTNYEIEASDLVAGTYYYIINDDNDSDVSITTDNGDDVSAKNAYSSSTRNHYKFVLCYYLENGVIKVRYLTYVWLILGQTWSNGSVGFETTCNKLIFDSNLDSVNYRESTTYSTSLTTIKTFSTGTYNMTNVSITIPSVNSLDKTDTTLIKIIKLPYRPTDKYFTGWLYDSTDKVIYLNNLNSSLEENIESTDINPYNDLFIDLSGISLSDSRSQNYETKLLHSDYYQYKFIYDSFSFVMALEKINLDDFDYDTRETLNITFTATNSVNSRFLFTFAQYITDGKTTEDYPNILYVARNNEVTIFNNDYMTYLKTGYNYDVKNKERREAGLWAGTALSLVGSVASFALGGGVGVGVGISLATSSMSQLINAVNSTAQAEASQEQKINQLRLQKSSVYGADDLDLMSKYTGNRLKVMLYKASERVRKTLFDLFFYTGYIDGTLGVPNMTSRTRFNFISAEPVFDLLVNIPEDILEDLTLKYNSGVTYLHIVNNSWDFEQQYENWETYLFN